jgi:hypothetical protein
MRKAITRFPTMSSNIFQLWKKNGDRVPFGARRDSWSANTHVLVEEVVLRRWPYGTAYGDVFRNGVRQQPLDPDVKRSSKGIPEISCAGCYQWIFVDLPGCLRGKPAFKTKSVRVLSAGDKIGFGIHRAATIDDVLRRDPSWVKWALQNVRYFAIDPLLFDTFNPPDPDSEIGEDFRAINEDRVRADRERSAP